MAKFRSGCPKLEVETGRWQKKEREERLCLLCHKAVRDISHFLSDCEALDGERKALKSILRDVANETFTTEVLNSIKDNQVVKQVVSTYVEIPRRFVSLAVIYLQFSMYLLLAPPLEFVFVSTFILSGYLCLCIISV